MHRPKPSLVVVFITILLDVLGIGIIIPVAPKLVAMVMGFPEHGMEARTSMPVALLASTYALMMFMFAPMLGSLSDKVGRRPVILIALFGSGVDYFIGSLAPTIGHWGALRFASGTPEQITHAATTIGLTTLFITRAINGLTGANISACTAYIADITAPEKRATAFGIIGAAFGVGFAFGPLIGGALGAVDVRLPYVGAGVLTMMNWLYGCFVLPESLPGDRRRAFSWAKANPLGAIRWLGHHHIVATIAAALFLVNMAQFALHATWVLSMGKRFDWGPWTVGASLCVVGVMAMIVQGGLSRRIIPAIGERACLVGGTIIAVFAYLGYGLATQGWMIFAIIVAASIGGLSQQSAQGIALKAVAPTEQGLLQGAMSGLTSIAGIAGYLTGGLAFEHFAPRGNIGAGAPFLASSLLAALALIPVLLVWKRMPTSVGQLPVEGADGQGG